MFDATVDIIETDRVIRYQILRDELPITFSEVLDLLADEPGFRNYFGRLLADAPFEGYRWETPGLAPQSAEQQFEFVLLNAPGFCSRKTDRRTYTCYFSDANDGVVIFPNLSGDATLIVPSPQADDDAYGHLAAFVRHAPKTQVDGLWRAVGQTVRERITKKPIWLSTAGGGVAWLHVRLDSSPKYYGHAPYRRR